LERSLELIGQIGASESYLTHMGCPIDYHQVQPDLPQGVQLAWDGLRIPLS
jgi:phosphoribosyl 1,2-cyclic phosphate phosphodiesterase